MDKVEATKWLLELNSHKGWEVIKGWMKDQILLHNQNVLDRLTVGEMDDCVRDAQRIAIYNQLMSLPETLAKEIESTQDIQE